MAALTPGTDITADSVEGGLLQLAQMLQDAEQLLSPAQNRIQFVVNTDTNVATITAAIPIAVAVGTSGKLEIVAAPYA
ncbi:hypothetical protein ACQ4M4_18075 [Leptolyngbya sp. AN02str]|uniref:hypothetical protein n=1 Tax=Leptolyngbya sp. AN02str TaxID=3423363 RepID=UPI003D32329C